MTAVATKRKTPAAGWKAPPEPDGRLCVRIPTSASTLKGFRAWAVSDAFPAHVRAAFIDEEIFIDMSNEDPESHVSVKGAVSSVLQSLTRALRFGKFYGSGVLISNEAAGFSNNPDASLLKFDSLRSGRVRLVPKEGGPGQYAEIEGSPDWIMEVLSDSSIEKDTVRLREAYRRAGIDEYWLIDARGEELDFQILHWRKNGYVAAIKRDGWQRSRIFGREFRLERRRDQIGLWEYTLHVRPA